MHLKHVGQTSTSWWDGVACSKPALGGELEKPDKITQVISWKASGGCYTIETRKAKAHSLSHNYKGDSPLQKMIYVLNSPKDVKGYYHPRCTGEKLIQ